MAEWKERRTFAFKSCFKKKMEKKHFDINTATDEEVITVVQGMLNAKKEWLQSIQQREKELGFA